jgi:predicted metalloprotease with PDZ domain
MLKIILTLLLIVNALNSSFAEKPNEYKAIVYNIKLSNNGKYLLIKTKYKGHFYRNVTIDLPYKWADQEYTTQIQNVQINNSRYFIKNDQSNKLVIDLDEPAELLEISYEAHTSKNKDFDTKTRNLLITSDLVLFPGHAILSTPDDINDKQKLDIEIIWEKLPKGWKVLSSHGPGQSLSFSATPYELVQSIYSAGKVRETVKSINDKKVIFSLYGNCDFSDKQIIKSSLEIIKSQRDFFNDYNFNNYLVSIIENCDKKLTGKKVAYFNGINMHNSISIYISKGIDIKQYKLLFAHEHMHNWIGGKISNSEESLGYWWSEGFNDYYSKIIAARDNIINADELATEINNILKEYYKSPSINLSNLEMSQNFWNNDSAGQMPYLRGFIFALYLDCNFNHKKSSNITELILMEFWQNHKIMPFSNNNFVKILKKHSKSPDYNKWFNDYIEQGKTINLNACHHLLID